MNMHLRALLLRDTVIPPLDIPRKCIAKSAVMVQRSFFGDGRKGLAGANFPDVDVSLGRYQELTFAKTIV
jgi:hypothetical protein